MQAIDIGIHHLLGSVYRNLPIVIAKGKTGFHAQSRTRRRTLLPGVRKRQQRSRLVQAFIGISHHLAFRWTGCHVCLFQSHAFVQHTVSPISCQFTISKTNHETSFTFILVYLLFAHSGCCSFLQRFQHFCSTSYSFVKGSPTSGNRTRLCRHYS